MPCFFCQRNVKEIDFKEAQLLRNFISSSGKIKAKKRTGVCSSHQRKLTKAIERARFLAILSPSGK
ncbi:MAG: 30S ribosomal protein S18 [Candidatus Nealsonbacteria bacterium RBG_13_42_11]|uniref:30S ribosomal protein S18 n=1 Tax=Candidatus Nealsonbacteria bacterium RBG_13_42_11 TaxID=1801663 RepID=A0A1G2DYR1_9BACT|nr:MAG: 30S ribosomal protein S18 [Candidatus Nealsonbacteria bacterium RBG_13_42_11]